MEMCMKYAKTRDLLLFLRDMVKLLKEVLEHDGNQYAEMALTYLMNTSEFNNKAELIDMMQANLLNETGEKIMTFAEFFREEGKMEGEQTAKKEIALTLLQEGLSMQAVSKITQLPLSDVETLNNSEAVVEG